MTCTLSRRGLAATAVTATALSGLALTGVAAGAAKTHTSLSVRAAKSAIHAGGSDAISGDLRAAGKPAANETVNLLARPTGTDHFTAVAQGTTGSRGGVGFRVSPATTTRYRLAFAGDATHRASRSGVVTVRVRAAHRHHDNRLHTSLSIRSAHRRIVTGGSDAISGKLRSDRHRVAAQRVVLQDRTGSTAWADEATHTTNRHGITRFVVRPTETTRYRLVFRGSPNFRPSHSGVRAVTVVETNLSIAASSTSVDPGDTDTISGVLTDQGAPVSGRSVELRDKVVGSHAGFTTVGTATTGTDGSVSFSVTPTQTTRYVLVAPATATDAATRSRVLTVVVRSGTTLSIVGRQGQKFFVVAGTLRGNGHVLAHRRVALERRDAGTTGDFTAVRSKQTNRHGYVAFHRRPSTSTDYELVFAGGRYYDGCHSGVVTATVA